CWPTLRCRASAAPERGLLVSQRLRPTDGLPACPTCIPRCCTTFRTQLQLKHGQTGQHSGHILQEYRGHEDPLGAGAVVSSSASISWSSVASTVGSHVAGGVTGIPNMRYSSAIRL